jgi:hypothetical protein
LWRASPEQQGLCEHLSPILPFTKCLMNHFHTKILLVFGPWLNLVCLLHTLLHTRNVITTLNHATQDLFLVCYRIYPLLHTLLHTRNSITTLDHATQDLTIAHLIPNITISFTRTQVLLCKDRKHQCAT